MYGLLRNRDALFLCCMGLKGPLLADLAFSMEVGDLRALILCTCFPFGDHM